MSIQAESSVLFSNGGSTLASDAETQANVSEQPEDRQNALDYDLGEATHAGVAVQDLQAPADNRTETRLQAENCIKNHVLLAVGIGLIPSATVDIVGIAAIEVNLIRALAEIYRFPTPHKLVAAKILISVAGSIGPVYLASHLPGSFKSVPLLGHALYVGFLSLSGGAAVYAVGKLFQEHYESGGTFLSSENLHIQNAFERYFAEGKTAAVDFARERTGS